MAVDVFTLVGSFNLIYNLSWLVFLTDKHYGQVTTTSGHIFELNVLLNYTLNTLSLLVTVNLELLPWGTLSEIINATTYYGYLVAMAGSQIETAIFLKKLDVNTMMTNTAGKIILVLDIISLGMGIIITLVVPLWRENQKKTQVCEFISPDAFYRFSIPLTVVIVIVLVVTGFAVFRSIKIRRKNQVAEIEVGLRNTLNVTPIPDRIFTIQARFPEAKRETEETPPGNVEDDLVVEDIEIVNTETTAVNRDLEDYHEIRIGNEENEKLEKEVGLRENMKKPHFQDRIITVQARSFELYRESEENHQAPPGNIEDDIVVEDTEIVDTEITVVNRDFEENHKTRQANEEVSQVENRNTLNYQTPLENVEDVIQTPHSMDQLSIHRMIQTMENNTEYQQNETPCLPGIAIIQTLNKYLKNGLISLLILTSEFPWYLTGVYAFISNSGCENTDFKITAEISFLDQCISYLFLTILIKKKLDRLSE